MRGPAHVPKLKENHSTLLMHRRGRKFPAFGHRAGACHGSQDDPVGQLEIVKVEEQKKDAV